MPTADRRPRPDRRRARRPLVALVALSLVLGACADDDDGEPAADADATTSTAAPSATTGAGPTTTEPVMSGRLDDLRGVRYCEVLLLSQVDGRFSADVWNTMGLSDCPQEDWDDLDAAAIAEERGALLALLNGPRYWMLDAIEARRTGPREETTFGTVGMFLAASVDLGDELPAQTPYTERSVLRDTVFEFAAGSPTYQLTDPDGTRYVLQSYSLQVDPTQTQDALGDLADRLELPDGWTFAVVVPEEPLRVLDADGVATVVQDELGNSYQRMDVLG